MRTNLTKNHELTDTYIKRIYSPAASKISNKELDRFFVEKSVLPHHSIKPLATMPCKHLKAIYKKS